jgi:hypothetical protein
MGVEIRISLLKKILAQILVVSLASTGCSNIYTQASNQGGDDVLFEEALKSADNLDYATALSYYGRMSATYLIRETVRKKYASALAGRCGMNFANLYTGVANVNLTGTTIFSYMRSTMQGVAVLPDYCTQAEAQIKAIWSYRAATTNEKLFVFLLSFAKVGAYLRNKSDNDGTGNLGDGSTDAAFNGCTNTNDSTHLTDAEIKEVITGFSLMLLNFTDFAATFASIGGNVTSINAVCAALTPNPCVITDAANVTAPMVDQFRDLLATNSAYVLAPMGIGSCAPATLLGSCCP